MTPAEPATSAPTRFAYLDGLRGAALIFMVLNHTARWWMGGHVTWSRYHLIYVTLTLSAPVVLFLVGFCLPLSLRSSAVFPDEPVLSGGVLQMVGFAIIVMVPAIWALARYRAAPWALLGIAVAGYVA